MNALVIASDQPDASERSRRWMMQHRRHRLTSSWRDVLFVHYEVDATVLQRQVPFELDLFDGRAFVSLVAFQLRNLRPVRGGRLGAWLMKPVSSHELLNVRTYVHHREEPGIFFLAEFLPNLLSLPAGPHLCGLPYRFARLSFQHRAETGRISGKGRRGSRRICYHGEVEAGAELEWGEPGSLDEFLVERYTAFTHRGGVDRSFRVWHPRWLIAPVELVLEETGLLRESGDWPEAARFVKAHYSPGFDDIWMSWPSKTGPE